VGLGYGRVSKVTVRVSRVSIRVMVRGNVREGIFQKGLF